MGKQYSRIQRGQVFWFDPIEAYGGYTTFIAFNKKEYNSSVQFNNRPWLVVSNNMGNSSSPTCNIVPITLENKTNIPTHVGFVFEGKSQTILCEQTRTVDCMSLGNYICTVSDEVLEQVEKALAIQFNIRPQVTYADFTLDSTIKHLETVIGQIISSKVDAIKYTLEKECPAGAIPVNQIEDTAVQLGQMIEDLVGGVKVETPEPVKKVVKSETVKPNKSTKITSGMSAIEKFNARYGGVTQPSKPEPVNDGVELVKSNSGRNRWTNESRQQYLQDCDNLSPQEIMKKYGFSNIQSVFQTKYRCRNVLINAGIIVED